MKRVIKASVDDQYKLSSLVGKQFPNDGRSLPDALRSLGELTAFKHVSNFRFEAVVDGTKVTIQTQPLDDDSEYIEVVRVN